MQIFYVTLILLSASRSVFAQDTLEDINHRLPNNTSPKHYKLHISVFMEPNFTFVGNDEITVLANEDTDRITLHADSLNITSINFATADGTVELKEIVEEPKADFVTFILNKKLKKGTEIKVRLEYHGKIRNDLTGLYRSSYLTKNQEKRWLAVTQFQPTSARYVFPCYDEPKFRTPFDICVEHDEQLDALSNMPKSDKPKTLPNGRLLTCFQTSIVMPTYLVAFLVSDYGVLPNSDKDFNIWTNKDSLEKASFASEFGQLSLEKLEKFSGKSYQLPKLDLIDVPDFKMGAMENWGMNTFRTAYILYEPGVSTTLNLQNTAKMVAHELSHNWFGNEVTPAWWDWIWLSEGMATLLEHQITNEIHPEWRMMDQYSIKVVQDVMLVDSTLNTRAMSAHIAKKENILFDYIVYQKSGSVLRMVQNMLTKKVFEEGLQEYLKKWSDRSVQPENMFVELEKAARKAQVLPNAVPLKEVLESWTTQEGFPLVTVTRNYTNKVTEFRQERFIADGSKDKKMTKFWIPLNFGNVSTDFENTEPTDWMRSSDESLIINIGTDPDAWILVNKQQMGYYRVNYDEQNWKLLANTLRSSKYTNIHLLNRAQILDDAVNLALAGRVNYRIALELMSYLKQETDYIPWTAVNNELAQLHLKLTSETDCDFEAFMENITRPVFNDLTFIEMESDSNTRKLHRAEILTWVCKLGMPECSAAKELLGKWRVGINEIPPNLKTAVYCGGLRNDDQDLWNFMKSQLKDATTAQERTALLTALGCTKSEDLLNEYLKMSIGKSSDLLEKKERDLVFQYVYSSGYQGIKAALGFLNSNMKEIQQSYNSLANSLIGFASYITSEKDIQKFKSMCDRFAEILSSEEQSAIELAIEILDINQKWSDNYHKTISQWLVDNKFEKKCDRSSSANFVVSVTLIMCSFIISKII